MSFTVYWTIIPNGVPIHQSKDFGIHDMKAALQFTESLRQQQMAGATIRSITMCSENPNSVGKAGASDVEPGYDWKKRRI